MAFSPDESLACNRLIALALAEDLGKNGDITSQAVIPAETAGEAVLVARQPGVLAGLPAVAQVLQTVDAHLQLEEWRADAAVLNPGDRIAAVRGSMRSILAGERTALNFLQHLSGIATQTRRHVEAVAGLNCRILDTRKTLPGWRLLAKYAVRQGGGTNHRVGLHDGILIKDNHWQAMASRFPSDAELERILSQARTQFPGVFVEVEVDDLCQFDSVLPLGPDAILLDNMSLAHMREAVRRRNLRAPGVLLEASGGITFDRLRQVAETGVDRISIGALTHSAPALDIALDYQSLPSPLGGEGQG